jgi:hypothetical protein
VRFFSKVRITLFYGTKGLHTKILVCELFVIIPEHFEPGPAGARPAHEPY